MLDGSAGRHEASFFMSIIYLKMSKLHTQEKHVQLTHLEDITLVASLNRPHTHPAVTKLASDQDSDRETHISQNIRPRHKPRRITRQKHRQPIQLIRPPQPPHRRHALPMLLLFIQPRLRIQRRVHIPRRNSIYTNAVWCPFCS